MTVTAHSTPTWLAERIADNRRTAKPTDCRQCGATILVGPDHDTCAATARVDPTPVDPITEVIALLAGLESYDYQRGELDYRNSFRHHSPRRTNPVLLTHVCTETRLF